MSHGFVSTDAANLFKTLKKVLINKHTQKMQQAANYYIIVSDD